MCRERSLHSLAALLHSLPRRQVDWRLSITNPLYQTSYLHLVAKRQWKNEQNGEHFCISPLQDDGNGRATEPAEYEKAQFAYSVTGH